jgi:hypothetical protein
MRRFTSQFPKFFFVAVLGVFAVSALSQPSLATSINGHLYAVVGQWNVERFPLFDGLPSHRADLTIPGHGPVLAIGVDGTVAAQRNSFPVIDFFAPGQIKPERTLNVLPPRHGCAVNIVGLVLDAGGNLYVSRLVPDPCFLDGIAVYGPKASGNAKPILSFLTSTGALAIDPRSGELFDSVGGGVRNQSSINVYANLSAHLRKERTIIAAAQWAQGIAINADCCLSGLWTYTVPNGPPPASIWAPNSLVEYETFAAGLTEPSNGISPELADRLPEGTVGYWKGKLYATFSNINAQGVEVFPNDGIGPQQPLATLTFPSCCISHFAVGL